MAGDWLKFEVSTLDKPEVLAIAGRLMLDPDAVVGKLLRVWAWFDSHTEDGHANVTLLSVALQLDRVVGVQGFVQVLHDVGWLTTTDNGVAMPNFGRHNGKSAKKRAEDARRKGLSRAVGTNVTDSADKKGKKSSTREEKSRDLKTAAANAHEEVADVPTVQSPPVPSGEPMPTGLMNALGTAGWPIHRIMDGQVIPMVRRWEREGVTPQQVADAIAIAISRCNGLPSKPTYLDGIVNDLREGKPNAGHQRNTSSSGFEAGDAIGDEWLREEREREAREREAVGG